MFVIQPLAYLMTTMLFICRNGQGHDDSDADTTNENVMFMMKFLKPSLRMLTIERKFVFWVKRMMMKMTIKKVMVMMMLTMNVLFA